MKNDYRRSRDGLMLRLDYWKHFTRQFKIVIKYESQEEFIENNITTKFVTKLKKLLYKISNQQEESK